jgi:hypothetical protein
MTSHFIVAGFNYLWNRGSSHADAQEDASQFVLHMFLHNISASQHHPLEKFRTSSFADTENNKLEHNPQTRVKKPA